MGEIWRVVENPGLAQELPVEWDWRTYERWTDFLHYTLDVFGIKCELSISLYVFRALSDSPGSY